MAITMRGGVLVSPTPTTNGHFGRSAALSANGSVLVVSTNLESRIYTYDWSGAAWVKRSADLTTSTSIVELALSSDGLVLAAGSEEYAIGGITARGGAYIYDWSGSAWVQRGGVLTVADAAASDNLGSALALSANGAVLAVGATGRDSGGVNRGGVYLFDWTAGAWVQRGSALVPAGAVDSDMFGAAVALSADGAILAVGAKKRDEGALVDNGGVYLFDWTAGAWVQRGAVVYIAGAYDDYAWFGGSVTLSGDGEVLAVGATYQDDGASNAGAVFIYDRSGSGWVKRGATLLAAVPQANALFGSAVSLSSDKNVLLVGAGDWGGTLAGQGGVYIYDTAPPALGFALVETRLDVVAIGAPVADTRLDTVAIDQVVCRTRLVMQGAGAAVAFATLTVTAFGLAAAPTALSIVGLVGAAIAPTRLTLNGIAGTSCPTLLAVLGVDPLTGTAHIPLWSARCLIDGVDVSARMVGQASVTCDEGAARIASLTLLPASGIVEPLDYVGKPITLDYVLVIGGTPVARRLFTGRIDTPEYDLSSTLLRLACVDDLQNRVAVLNRSVISQLVGGRYTEAVQGEIADNWDYAQARLSTVAASLDAGASGGMRVTPWEIATSWATFTESDLLYQRAILSLPQRSRLVNTVSIEFEYRYQRLRQRYTTLGWSGTQIDMAPNGYQYPTKQDILGAAGGSGWTVTLGIFYPAPAAIPHSSGGFIHPADGSIDMAILHLAQRHSQTVTEAYSITVSAPESTALNGDLPHSFRGGLASSFDGTAWESAPDISPMMASSGEQDYAPDAARPAADDAISTLLDQARVKILSTHRGARVGNAILCNPDLDLDKRVTINTAAVTASGKVSSVTHVLDFAAGSAISEFSLALFGAGGAGIITPQTLAPPAPPAGAVETQEWPPSIPPLFVNTYGVTPYTDNLMGLLLNPTENITVDNVPGPNGPSTKSFPNPFYVPGGYPATGFRVRMPGVDDADRNPISHPTSASYSLVIPSDPLVFTVP